MGGRKDEKDCLVVKVLERQQRTEKKEGIVESLSRWGPRTDQCMISLILMITRHCIGQAFAKKSFMNRCHPFSAAVSADEHFKLAAREDWVE